MEVFTKFKAFPIPEEPIVFFKFLIDSISDEYFFIFIFRSLFLEYTLFVFSFIVRLSVDVEKTNVRTEDTIELVNAPYNAIYCMFLI